MVGAANQNVVIRFWEIRHHVRALPNFDLGFTGARLETEKPSMDVSATYSLATDLVPPFVPSAGNREPEMLWLKTHSSEYLEEWVVVEKGSLIAHGPDYLRVRREAVAAGIQVPFIIYIPRDADRYAFMGL